MLTISYMIFFFKLFGKLCEASNIVLYHPNIHSKTEYTEVFFLH